MIDWFRHRHGLTTDAKLAFVAKRTKIHRAFVVFLWSHLLERASAADDRGSIACVDRDEVAFALDMKRPQVDALMAEFEGRGLIFQDRLTTWEKHHPGAATSTERVKMFRERQRASDAEDDETFQKRSWNAKETGETPFIYSSDSRSESEGEGAGEGGRKRAKPKVSKRCRDLADLTLDGDLAAIAAEEGRDGDRELRKFQDYCVAKDVRYADYRAGFRNWLRSHFGRQPPPSRQGPSQTSDPAKFARGQAKAELLRAGNREHEEGFGRLLHDRTREILSAKAGAMPGRA